MRAGLVAVCILVSCALSQEPTPVAPTVPPQVVKVCIRGDTHELFLFNQELVRKIAQNLQHKYAFEEYPLDERNGTWNELVQQTADGHWDLAAAGFFESKERTAIVDFTHPIMHSPYALVVLHKPDIDGLLIVNPFRWPLWTMIFVCILCIAVLHYVLEPQVPTGWRGISDSIWWSAMLPLTPPNPPPRVFLLRLGTWIFKCFWLIVVSVYTANLTAIVTVVNQSMAKVEMSDLLTQTVTVPRGTQTATYARQKGFRNLEEIGDSPVEALQLVADRKVSAALNTENILRIGLNNVSSEHKHCKLALTARDTVHPVSFATPLGRHSFNQEISIQILTLRDSGALSELELKYMPAHDCVVSPRDGMPLNSQVSTFVLFGGACILWFGSVFVSAWKTKRTKGVIGTIGKVVEVEENVTLKHLKSDIQKLEQQIQILIKEQEQNVLRHINNNNQQFLQDLKQSFNNQLQSEITSSDSKEGPQPPAAANDNKRSKEVGNGSGDGGGGSGGEEHPTAYREKNPIPSTVSRPRHATNAYHHSYDHYSTSQQQPSTHTPLSYTHGNRSRAYHISGTSSLSSSSSEPSGGERIMGITMTDDGDTSLDVPATYTSQQLAMLGSSTTPTTPLTHPLLYGAYNHHHHPPPPYTTTPPATYPPTYP